MVQPLLNKYGIEKKDKDICDVKGCEELAVSPQGAPSNFQGSPLCNKCHFSMYQDLVNGKPSVIHFLTNVVGKKSQAFKTMSKTEFPPNTAKFYVVVENYRCCRIAVRYLFAEGMYENYLGATAKKKK
eukprot:TRINITY_DN1408_c0_g1_i1.p1 TRINITY_DN1408_c0_g1~~TRINITY_DN1408_c0_g1_i1.p1  ORF type:complete len:128 (+),score=15.27 TRINITY_DN1408_c0_g1_i1:457-840(+)